MDALAWARRRAVGLVVVPPRGRRGKSAGSEVTNQDMTSTSASSPHTRISLSPPPRPVDVEYVIPFRFKLEVAHRRVEMISRRAEKSFSEALMSSGRAEKLSLRTE